MARQAFYSFHYKPDNWRASQVRTMGLLEGNKPAADNDWETIEKGGDKAIQEWIDNQMKGRSVLIVLIGENTAGRKWINYEIIKAWNDKKGVLGIHIHNLKDSKNNQCNKGSNPFTNIKVGDKPLDEIVKTYDPSYTTSTYVYSHIKENLSDWIETAIEIRNKYKQ
ncbi:MAG: TIR domain-containing protein [Aliarcobacter sp.]|nr:TIR domain-containing protein [Aliarcobacter sp.]